MITMGTRLAAAEYSSSGMAVSTPANTMRKLSQGCDVTAMGSGVAGTRPHSAGIRVPAPKMMPPRMPVGITDSSAMPGSAG